jgi:hypothetical protein
VTQVAPIETIPTPPVAPIAQPEAPFELYKDVPKLTMVSVLLAKNYRPQEDIDPADKTKRLPPVFEIVGYWKDEIKRKNPAGQEIIIQKREFVPDEARPPVQAGTGSDTKLLAGTVVKLRKSEAKYVRDNGIGTIELDDD